MTKITCDKVGCSNTNVTRHSTKYGFICDDCFENLFKRHPSPEEKFILWFMTGRTSRANQARQAKAMKRYEAIFPKKNLGSMLEIEALEGEAINLVTTPMDKRINLGRIADNSYAFMTPHGHLRSYELRAIADELDRRNGDWQRQIEENLSND